MVPLKASPISAPDEVNPLTRRTSLLQLIRCVELRRGRRRPGIDQAFGFEDAEYRCVKRAELVVGPRGQAVQADHYDQVVPRTAEPPNPIAIRRALVEPYRRGSTGQPRLAEAECKAPRVHR